MNLFLFGYKKSGKSYYGLQVAQKMQMHFIDTDQLVEELFTARHHKTLSCKEIVLTHGQKFFRELEKQVIYSLENIKNTVIALGGGAVLDENNVQHIKKFGTLVYIKADKQVLKKRILSDELPSYIDPKDPNGSFEKMFEERKTFYESIQGFTAETDNKTDLEIIDYLCELVKTLKGLDGE